MKNKVFFGVCGGLAEYFDVNPVVVKILLLILFVIDLRFVIVYFILALIMPKGTEERAAINDENSRRVLGYGLIAIGILILFHEFFALLNTSLLIALVWGCISFILVLVIIFLSLFLTPSLPY